MYETYFSYVEYRWDETDDEITQILKPKTNEKPALLRLSPLIRDKQSWLFIFSLILTDFCLHGGGCQGRESSRRE